MILQRENKLSRSLRAWIPLLTGIFAEMRRRWYSGKYRASNGLLSLDCVVSRFNRVASDYWCHEEFLGKRLLASPMPLYPITPPLYQNGNLAVSSKQFSTPPTWPPFVILYWNFSRPVTLRTSVSFEVRRFKESSRHSWELLWTHVCRTCLTSDFRRIHLIYVTPR